MCWRSPWPENLFTGPHKNYIKNLKRHFSLEKNKSICQTNKKGRFEQHGSKWAVPDLAIATDFNCSKGKVESVSSHRLGWDMKDVRMGSKCRFYSLENKNKLWAWELPGHNIYQQFDSSYFVAANGSKQKFKVQTLQWPERSRGIETWTPAANLCREKLLGSSGCLIPL